MEISIALNKLVVGKVRPGDLCWPRYNCGFHAANVSIPQLQSHIAQGYAFTAVHHHVRRFRNHRWSSYRIAENFDYGQHAGIDFDGSSFDDIARIPLVANNANFGYTTTRHTDEEPRCRAVFVLAESIRDIRRYRALIRGLLHSVGKTADASCSDPLRIFFGSADCQFIEFGGVLNPEKTDELVELAATARASGVNLARGQTPWELIRLALDAIEAKPRVTYGRWTYPIPYATWRNIVWAVASEYDTPDAAAYLEEWSPCRRAGEVIALMEQADGTIGIGTLFHAAQTIANWQMPDAAKLVEWSDES